MKMVTTPINESDEASLRSRWVAASLLLWTLLVIVVGIWLIDSSQRRAAQDLQAAATTQAERVRDRIDADLDVMRALPLVLAAQVNARTLLLDTMRNPGAPIRNTSLNAHYARIAKMVGVDTIFLADANGTIIAAHSFTTDDSTMLVGNDASQREYFQRAKAGQQGEQFAIAKLSKLPSVFFSAPVIENDVFIGAVVVKATTERMRRMLSVAGNPRALLIDAHQVVIAASDATDYLRRANATAPLSGTLDQRYEDARPDENPIAFVDARRFGPVQSRKTSAGEGPYVTGQMPLNDNNWTVLLLLGLEPIRMVTRQWRVALVLAWLVGALIILLVIRSVRLLQDLDRLANIDVLSGLGNRRHYESVVGSLCDAHDRARIQHVALALFDLDNFKQVNDEHGHAVGDLIIEEFAEQLTNSTRRMDHLFRLGGDEFAALILELTPKAAEQAVLGIQARLRMASSVSDRLPQPGVSIGLAYHQSGESPDELYRRADQALYAAKDGGRNRLHVAESTGE